MIISLEYIYYVTGLLLLVIAFFSAKDKTNPKRILTAVFWGLYAVTFLFGSYLPAIYMGILVIVMAVIAGCGGVQGGSYPAKSLKECALSAQRLGNRLFGPAVLIPVITVIGVLWLKDVKIAGLPLMDQANPTLVSLGIASVIAVGAAVKLTRENAVQPLKEARRLVDAIGWACVLPQMLATLGALFAAAGVGQVIADLVGSVIAVDNRFLVVAAYVVGMALFTMIMGNAFAAFPVMTAGIGLPLIVKLHGGNPAVLAAIGMYSGYCGTLMTPMAANFNIVPAALLDLPDKNGVIKAQITTGVLLLTVNIFLLYYLAF